MLFMKTENDLVALRDKMKNVIHAATNIEKKVMAGEAEVRRYGLSLLLSERSELNELRCFQNWRRQKHFCLIIKESRVTDDVP